MTTLIRNIGQIVSGDIARPLRDGDSILIREGKIAAVGQGLDEDADTVIDARGSTVIPGLLDSHCHPVFGDFTPRQRAVDFIESGLHGGGSSPTSPRSATSRRRRRCAWRPAIPRAFTGCPSA